MAETQKGPSGSNREGNREVNLVVTIRRNREKESRGDNAIANPSGGEKWDGGTVLQY